MTADLNTPAPFAVTASARDGMVTAYLRGGLDASTAATAREQLAQLLAGRPSGLVFDLAGLEFLDCVGARVLTDAARFLPAGQRPVVRSPRPIVARLLQLASLDRQLVIEPPGPGNDGPPSEGSLLAGLTGVVRGEHARIGRLFAGLDGTAHYAATRGRDAGPDWILAAAWARIATFLELHAAAEQEICYPAVFGRHTGHAAGWYTAVADLEDLHEAVTETRLYPAGGPPWWRAVEAARCAAIDHISRLDRILASFAEHADPQTSGRLARQWDAFIAARRRDATRARDRVAAASAPRY